MNLGDRQIDLDEFRKAKDDMVATAEKSLSDPRFLTLAIALMLEGGSRYMAQLLEHAMKKDMPMDELMSQIVDKQTAIDDIMRYSIAIALSHIHDKDPEKFAYLTTAQAVCEEWAVVEAKRKQEGGA